MYEHPFTIKEVAWLLSIRCLDGGSAQEFPVECPYCGDTRGKCSFCVSKNGEMKNVFNCFHCGESGNMLTLYADIMGFYGADRCKEAYQDIRKRLENGTPPGSMAVLYRTANQARPLLDRMMEFNVPFSVRDGMPDIYHHWIALDMMSPHRHGRPGAEGFSAGHEPAQPVHQPGSGEQRSAFL